MLKAAPWVLLAAAASACGGSDGGSTQPAPRPVVGFSLSEMKDTVWQSSCLVTTKGDASALVSYTLGESLMDKLTSYFHGTTCDSSALFAQRGAAYENVSVTDSSSALANSYRARGRLVAVTFVSKQDSFTTELNSQNVYGSKAWATNTPRDVSGLKYDAGTRAEPPQGSTVNVLYAVEDDVLYFGYNAGDGTLYLDKDEPYTRPE